MLIRWTACREWALGGEYPAVAAALEDYVLRLRSGGVELLVALDPATGTDEDDDKKEGELLRRFQQRCETVGKGPLSVYLLV